MIPWGSTPIKHIVLVDIVAKGLLEKNEIRISAYIWRESWGYDAKDRRHDWTRSLTHEKISLDIHMQRNTVSSNIKRMVQERILKKRGRQYQFNEHYEEWKRWPKIEPKWKKWEQLKKKSKNPTVKNLDLKSHTTGQNMSQNLPDNAKNLDTQSTSDSMKTSISAPSKDTCKDIFKKPKKEVNQETEFLDYFNLKTGKNLKLISVRARIITQRLEEGHTMKELKTCVDNFAKDDWQGRKNYMDVVYCIGVRNKVDNLERWLHYKTPHEKSITPMSMSKAIDIAFRNQTMNEWEKILLSLDEKRFDKFKEWVKKPDKKFPDKKALYLRTVRYLEKKEVKRDFSL